MNKGEDQSPKPEERAVFGELLGVGGKELDGAKDRDVVEDPVEQEGKTVEDVQSHIDLVSATLVQDLEDLVCLVDAFEETEKLSGVSHADWKGKREKQRVKRVTLEVKGTK